MRNVASVLLDTVEDNPSVKDDFFRECYVPLEANNRHLLLSKNIISFRYKRVSDDGIAPARFGTSVADGRIQLDEAAQGVALSGQPIVVIGNVGVGKTSFFENLFGQLDPQEKQSTIYLHLDLGHKATLSVDVKSYILHNLPMVLRDKYGIDIEAATFVDQLYAADLERFDNGVEGKLKAVSPSDYERARITFLQRRVNEVDSHLQRSLRYLARSVHRQIVLVVDNADQRSFETQQEAFLIAQELASSRDLLVFVALRPSTFYLSKLTGALSGYKNRVLTISPPPADEVIRRRIAFALRVAEGKTAPAALQGIRLNLTSIVLLLEATLRSIRSNQQIRTFLSNITGGNTRLVI
jgi:GTPase SAR1 family protein